MRVLLTGASGFLGAAAAAALEARGYQIRIAGRLKPAGALPHGREFALIGDLRATVDWGSALDGCQAVVHLAAIAHRDANANDIVAVNAAAPVALAAAAARHGVRRFVFVSSVKAVGEDSGLDVWTESVEAKPTTLYGIAKLRAELGILATNNIETVVLRPPLVHAADARANFRLLLKIADAPFPVPLGGVINQRSFISRTGLADRIALATDLGRATGVFFVTDSPPLSTSEAVRALQRGLGRPDQLMPVLPFLDLLPPLRPIFGSLAVSEARFCNSFPWHSETTSQAALEETARVWKRALR